MDKKIIIIFVVIIVIFVIYYYYIIPKQGDETKPFSFKKNKEVMFDTIKNFEGTNIYDGLHVAYIDIAGHNTIGYGHRDDVNLIPFVPNNPKYPLASATKIDDDTANQYLVNDVHPIVRYLKSLNIAFTLNMVDALTSFIYNEGLGAFEGSSLLKQLKIDFTDKDKIIPLWAEWHYVHEIINGKRVPVSSQDLISRRTKELDIYFS